MRLALISEHASPLAALGGVDSGGQNVYVAQIGRHLAAAGHEVDIFTRRDSEDLATVLDIGNGLRVVQVPAGPPRFVAKEDMLPFMDDFARWMLEFIRHEGTYDLCHANFFMSGAVASQLKAILNIPFAITFHALGLVRQMHQGSADRFPARRSVIERQLMDDADVILAECPQDRSDQVQLYGANSSRIRIVPCGFDPREMWPVDRLHARHRLGIRPEERLVVHVGRMVPRKGVDTAISGFARLVHGHKIPARMLVVGGESHDPDPRLTPELGRLANLAAQEKVADNVVFTGRRGRAVLRFYYAAADVFVTTPWYEPFGITPVEAMACGAPVIGSEVGGIKYTVRHGETGFLVPPKNPAAIGMCLAQLFQSPGLAARMREASIARVNQHFTWRCVSEQIASIFAEVVAGRPPAPPLRTEVATEPDIVVPR